MNVGQLKKALASIPEEFDDVPVVGNWGYECEQEEATGAEIDWTYPPFGSAWPERADGQVLVWRLTS